MKAGNPNFALRPSTNIDLYSLLTFLGLSIFFLLPAEAISSSNPINFAIPEPTGLWYAISGGGLAKSYINLIELIFLFVAIGYFANNMTYGKIQFRIDMVLVVGLVYYTVSFISLIISYNSTYQDVLDRFPYDGLINWGKAFLLYFILLQIANREFLNRLFYLLIYVGVLLSFVSIAAFFIFGYFIYQERFMGWRVNVLGMGFNTGGVFLASLALLAYIFRRKDKIFWIYFMVLLLGVLLTGSRAAILSLLIGLMLYYGLFNGKLNQKYIWRFIWFMLAIVVVASLIIVSSVFTWLSNVTGFTIFSRLDSLTDITSDQSAFARFFIWANYIRIYSESILIGIGNSDWLIEIISRSYGYPYRVPHSHNLLLQTLIKGGVIATIPLVWIFLRNYWYALISEVKSSNYKAALAVIPFLFSGMIGYGFWNQKLVYLFTILIFSICHNSIKNKMFNFSLS